MEMNFCMFRFANNIINIFRYFTTIELVKKLQNNGIHVTAAIQANRLPISMELKQSYENLDLNESLFWQYNKLDHSMIISAWQDKKLCFHISTLHTNEILTSRKSIRAQKREKRMNRFCELNNSKFTYYTNIKHKFVDSSCEVVENFIKNRANSAQEKFINTKIQKRKKRSKSVDNEKNIPVIVSEYSKFMKGVDIFNQACSYYNFPHKSIRWYRSIINWLMELALNNSYKLYSQICDTNLTALKFRQSIIKNWEAEYLKIETLSGVTSDLSQNSSSTDNDHEYVCRLQKFGIKGDCDICSDRSTTRVITSYVCMNKNCMIMSKRCDRPDRYLRVHPECFHLHLK